MSPCDTNSWVCIGSRSTFIYIILISSLWNFIIRRCTYLITHLSVPQQKHFLAIKNIRCQVSLQNVCIIPLRILGKTNTWLKGKNQRKKNNIRSGLCSQQSVFIFITLNSTWVNGIIKKKNPVIYTFPKKTIVRLTRIIEGLLHIMLIKPESGGMLKAEKQEKCLNHTH